jgi:hypothetical protein
MKLFSAAFLLIAISISVIIARQKNSGKKNEIPEAEIIFLNKNIRLQKYAAMAKTFVAKNNFNKAYCFLVDMKLPSGKKRFFIYNFKGDTVISAGLVTQGSGSTTETDVLQFSNTPNSNATSLGKYKIGQQYYGKFGLAFKLYGLDNTNSNAFKRAVVLHAHPLVPANEIYPEPLCVSWGCPTVNPDFLVELKKYITKSDKPILLYIFY